MRWYRKAAFPSGSFNAWISPAGDAHVVPNGMTHQRWIAESLETDANTAFAQGWIRVSIAGFSLIEAQDLIASLPVIQQALRPLMNQVGNRKIWIEDHANEIDQASDLATLVLGSPEDILGETHRAPQPQQPQVVANPPR